MNKAMSQKRRAVKELKFLIRQGRKMARQINRKLESLEAINRARAAAQERLIKICGQK